MDRTERELEANLLDNSQEHRFRPIQRFVATYPSSMVMPIIYYTTMFRDHDYTDKWKSICDFSLYIISLLLAFTIAKCKHFESESPDPVKAKIWRRAITFLLCASLIVLYVSTLGMELELYWQRWVYVGLALLFVVILFVHIAFVEFPEKDDTTFIGKLRNYFLLFPNGVPLIVMYFIPAVPMGILNYLDNPLMTIFTLLLGAVFGMFVSFFKANDFQILDQQMEVKKWKRVMILWIIVMIVLAMVIASYNGQVDNYSTKIVKYGLGIYGVVLAINHVCFVELAEVKEDVPGDIV